MDSEKISKEVSDTQAVTSKKQFIDTIKDEFKNSPLASNVVIGFILAGLEQLVEVDFACPCKPELNAWFASAYFIIPGVAASVLMLYIQGFTCTTLCAQDYEKLALFGLGPLMTWLMLVFFDGQYFACAKTDWPGRFAIINKAAPQRWCQPDNTTLEKMSQTQQWYFHSQVIGLVLLVISTAILVGHECINRRRNKNSDKTGRHADPAQEEEMERLGHETIITGKSTSL